MNGKRFKVVLLDDSPVSLSIENSFDFDSNEIYMKVRDRYLEFGWAKLVQPENGKLQVEMTLVGNYEIEESTATRPDLVTLKGVLPISAEAVKKMTGKREETPFNLRSGLDQALRDAEGDHL